MAHGPNMHFDKPFVNQLECRKLQGHTMKKVTMKEFIFLLLKT